jgi:RNA polymerase sigma-70 factor (ECF subfamily)
MQIGYALPDVTVRHFRTDVAETSDEALIEAIADGDKQALKVLFNRHNVQVHRFALRLTGNPSTAEDIVNEVFFDVWRQAAGFEEKSRVSTWLLAIARYKAISVIRRCSELQWDEEFTSTIEDSADNPEQSTDKKGRNAILRQCLSQLSPAQREVIDLVYYHEKSIGEVAEILNASENTVKTRMFYARKRLAMLLGDKGIHTMRS